MASARYTTLVAVLDDPINKLIIERELRRRTTQSKVTPSRWFPPPSVIAGGGGYLILTPREWATRPVGKSIDAGDAVGRDFLAYVWLVAEAEWYVTLIDGTEVGPFGSANKARDEAVAILIDQGWVLHDPPPWTEEDANDYPLK